MKCEECEVLLAQGELSAPVEEHLAVCAACRGIAEDLRANASVLEALRDEELPRIAIKTPRSRNVYPWLAGAAAAAALVAGLLLPRPAAAPAPPVAAVVPQQPEAIPPPARVAETPPAPAQNRAQKLQPLKIKMLTPDPDVVIYWIVD